MNRQITNGDVNDRIGHIIHIFNVRGKLLPPRRSLLFCFCNMFPIAVGNQVHRANVLGRMSNVLGRMLIPRRWSGAGVGVGMSKGTEYYFRLINITSG